MHIEIAPKGTVGLIMQNEDGKVIQLGMNEEQSKLLNMFVASLSKDKPLYNLGFVQVNPPTG